MPGKTASIEWATPQDIHLQHRLQAHRRRGREPESTRRSRRKPPEPPSARLAASIEANRFGHDRLGCVTSADSRGHASPPRFGAEAPWRLASSSGPRGRDRSGRASTPEPVPARTRSPGRSLGRPPVRMMVERASSVPPLRLRVSTVSRDSIQVIARPRVKPAGFSSGARCCEFGTSSLSTVRGGVRPGNCAVERKGEPSP